MLTNLLLAATVALAPLPAHAGITDSSHDDGQVITAPPGQFSFTANEDLIVVEGANSSNIIAIQDAAGGFYGDGCAAVDGPSISTAAALGEPGTYAVSYQVTSADGHAISGSISIEWAPEGDFEPASGSAELPVCGVSPMPATEPTTSSAQARDETADTSAQNSDDAAVGAPAPEASRVTPLVLTAGVAAALAVLTVIVTVVLRRRRTRP